MALLFFQKTIFTPLYGLNLPRRPDHLAGLIQQSGGAAVGVVRIIIYSLRRFIILACGIRHQHRQRLKTTGIVNPLPSIVTRHIAQQRISVPIKPSNNAIGFLANPPA